MSDQLLHSSPEKQGISSSAILAFLDEVEKSKQELHSFVIVRHGYVVAEGGWAPYGPQRPHMLFSLSKSFTSSAIGLAVAEGLLSVDDPVISFFPEEVTKEIKENMADMSIKHLLMMGTGHAEDTMERIQEEKDGNWVRGFLQAKIDDEPGTHFVYNSGATYMLSAIIQKVTGQTVLDYLQPRLFEPLAIAGATWEFCPRGINAGGWGLSINTRDIAKFGQMYLQKGEWNGRRILSQAWVEEATASHISNAGSENIDWSQGYGYQFWRCRHGAYRGDGAFGQYCVVMPDQEAVIAITSGVKDMQAVLNVIWEQLLPAMGHAPLPDDSSAQALLEQKIATLAYVPPRIHSRSSVAMDVSEKRYKMEDNKDEVRAVSFVFEQDACVFTLWDKRGEHRVRCGIGKWIEGVTALRGDSTPVAASGTWSEEITFTLTLRFVETPFFDRVNCFFEGDQLRIETCEYVSFGPKKRTVLKGSIV